MQEKGNFNGKREKVDGRGQEIKKKIPEAIGGNRIELEELKKK